MDWITPSPSQSGPTIALGDLPSSKEDAIADFYALLRAMITSRSKRLREILPLEAETPYGSPWKSTIICQNLKKILKTLAAAKLAKPVIIQPANRAFFENEKAIKVF